MPVFGRIIRGLVRENHRSTTTAENDNGGIAVSGKSKKEKKPRTPARFGTRAQVRKRYERDGLELESMWLGEDDMKRDNSRPAFIEQPSPKTVVKH